MSRILECLRSKFEDFTHKKSITRQINQIHCFKGAHLTLSQIQFEGAHLRILQCNPKNAKSLHLPDLRQKRVCYQSNVPPQTAMCLQPWLPWLTSYWTGQFRPNIIQQEQIYDRNCQPSCHIEWFLSRGVCISKIHLKSPSTLSQHWR